jgi:hypothetical protein
VLRKATFVTVDLLAGSHELARFAAVRLDAGQLPVVRFGSMRLRPRRILGRVGQLIRVAPLI